jgi:hypothetical protein
LENGSRTEGHLCPADRKALPIGANAGQNTTRTQGNAAKRWCFIPCVLSLEEIMGAPTWLAIAGTENGVQGFQIYTSGLRDIERWRP